MNYASTRIETADAAKYILKLCRHFAHKVPAHFSDHEGTVQFLQGQCVMKAEAQALCIYLQAEEAQKTDLMKFIIDDHLKRFVRFETLSYEWCANVPEAFKADLDALVVPGSQP